MDISLNRTYKMRKFSPGSYQLAIQRICQLLEIDTATLTLRTLYDHGDGLSETRNLKVEELGTVISLQSTPRQIEFGCTLPSGNYFYFLNFNQDGNIAVYVSSDDATLSNEILRIIADTLNLQSKEIMDSSQRDHDSSDPRHKVLQNISTSITDNQDKEDGPSYPDKITLSWLAQHAPISFWLWLLGIILAVFSVGVKAGQIPSIQQLFK